MSAAKRALVPVERVAAFLHIIRSQTVIIDSDIAALFGVETRVLLQAVRRNLKRFPLDFMFQLTKAEFKIWRSQFVISNPSAKMGLRRAPYAFTEHGVAMLSSVLHSERAIAVNISIIRTFVKLRRILASNEELARKVAQHDQEISLLFQHVEGLLTLPD